MKKTVINFEVFAQQICIPLTQTKIRTLSAIGLLCILIQSCEKENHEVSVEQITEEIIPEESLLTVEYDTNSSLKKEFALAIATAVDQSEALRSFLKEEALKMFNNDYDILYAMVKEKPLSNGQSFRELLLEYITEDRLIEIENAIPLLTIFIPELPEDSFSATSWNVYNEIPKVALRMNNTNNVPIFDAQGNEIVLSSDRVPAYPVLVIKDNERVTAQTITDKTSLENVLFSDSNNVAYQLLDAAFDGSQNTDQQKSPGSPDPKITTASSIYASKDGWQRDYIYYDITPTKTTGAFSYDFQEHVLSFELIGDPKSTYQKIADQSGEPILMDTSSREEPIALNWTGGAFEFKIKTLVNAQNGVGAEVVVYFSATQSQLFTIEYDRRLSGRTYYYFFESIAFNNPSIPLSLPIFNWDLENYSSSIKIDIEEVDDTTTTTLTDVRSTTYASNFEISGTIQKIGLKFGASRKETRSQSVKKSYTQANDPLGGVIINFADDIYSNGSFRTYKTGYYNLVVAPKRVQ